jgi:hypothetical protein
MVLFEAVKKRGDIKLTVTLQEITPEIEKLELPSQIEIIVDKLSDFEIADLYLNHDVSIQIPSHEGIGIGFYESISLGTPVVTIDRSPHREAVVTNRSGWLLPATPMALPDNPYGVTDAAQLKPGTLTRFILELTPQDLLKTSNETKAFYQERFSNSQFAIHLVSNIYSKKLINNNSMIYNLSWLELKYNRVFNSIIYFGKKFVYSKILISTNRKYLIKEKALQLDRLIRKLF